MLTNRQDRPTTQRQNTPGGSALATWAAKLGIVVLASIALSGCDQPTTSTYTLPEERRPDAAQSDGDTTTQAPPQSADSQAAKPSERAATSRIADKTFDDIKFDIEPDAPFDRGMLTDEIEALTGKRIRIRGWMRPTFQRKGIKQFVLVRDNLECCFGPGAALYDCIRVEMVSGATADFSTRSIAVEGTFSIDEFIGPDGHHWAIYHLEGELVK